MTPSSSDTGSAGSAGSDKAGEAETGDQVVPDGESPTESAVSADSTVPESTGDGGAAEELAKPYAKRRTSEAVDLIPDSEMKWYVVHAYSGFEAKVKQMLEERIRTYHMETLFGDIHVPHETVVELVRGQKKTSNRKFFPGYVLVQMILNQDTWHLVRETPKVTGFLGDKIQPVPLSPDEVVRITSQVSEGTASPRAKMNFQQGETVKVIDGPFADFNGTVEEVKPEKGKVKVLISIFGRATPVELDFIQVEKL